MTKKAPSIDDLMRKLSPNISKQKMKRLNSVACNIYDISTEMEAMDVPPKEFNSHLETNKRLYLGTRFNQDEPTRGMKKFNEFYAKEGLNEIDARRHLASLALKYSRKTVDGQKNPGNPYWIAAQILEDIDVKMSTRLKIEGYHVEGGWDGMSNHIPPKYGGSKYLSMDSLSPEILQEVFDRFEHCLNAEVIMEWGETHNLSTNIYNEIGSRNIRDHFLSAKAYRQAGNLEGLENSFNHALRIFEGPNQAVRNVCPSAGIPFTETPWGQAGSVSKEMEIVSKINPSLKPDLYLPNVPEKDLEKMMGWENYFRLGTSIEHNKLTYNRGPRVYEGRLTKGINKDGFFAGVFETGAEDTYHTLVLSDNLVGWKIGIERRLAQNPCYTFSPINLEKLDVEKKGDRHIANLTYRVGDAYNSEVKTRAFELCEKDKSLRIKLSKRDLDKGNFLQWSN